MGAPRTEFSRGEAAPERVVLLDESGTPIGTDDKRLVHHASTPLHLAFSCYLFDDVGNVLVTRRALSKITWPGVWTNSFCGHPAPGEEMRVAVERRAWEELGVGISDLRAVVPDFRYRAVDPSGVVENEVCPVYEATVSGTVSPHTEEVMEWAWTDPASLAQASALAPFAFSPWMVLQMRMLGWAGARQDAGRDGSETSGAR